MDLKPENAQAKLLVDSIFLDLGHDGSVMTCRELLSAKCLVTQSTCPFGDSIFDSFLSTLSRNKKCPNIQCVCEHQLTSESIQCASETAFYLVLS